MNALSTQRRGSILLAGIAALAMFVVAGCNIIVPIAYILEGPPSTEAQYTLPPKKAVVFVDDTKNNLPRTSLRTQIGDGISETILSKQLVPEAIASREALQVARKKDTDRVKLSIGEVGQEVGAEIIIYVKVTGFYITPDGATPKPLATAEVKVLDVAAGRRLFPDPGAAEGGVQVITKMREVSLESYQSGAGRRQIEDALAKELAVEVAKLFYKHETNELGGGLGVK